jgi:hypothetical protein
LLLMSIETAKKKTPDPNWKSGFCNPSNDAESHARCIELFSTGNQCTCTCHANLFKDAKTLNEAVAQAIGLGSACWTPSPGDPDAVFDEETANHAVDDLVKWIEDRYTRG